MEHHSIQTALAAFRAAPLSRKKAMLLVLLIDAEIDRAFAASGEDDPLAYRARRAAVSPALALVMDLAAMRDDGQKLVVEPVPVPIADYSRLSEADYMVSLYNQNTVPRVLVAMVGGGRVEAMRVLEDAVAALGRR